MANKVSISHALSVLHSKKHHKLIDVFNAVCSMSIQTRRDWYIEALSGEIDTSNEYIFIVRTANPSICCLSKMILEEACYMHRSTVTKCIAELVDMGLLRYNPSYLGWEIIGMENAFNRSDSEASSGGYMELKKLFFSREFYDMNVTLKKIVYYCSILMSTKGFKSKNSFIINLKKENPEWTSFLNTDNIYYVKSLISRLLEESSLLKKLEQKQYAHRNIKNKNRFLFILKPLERLKLSIKDSRISARDKLENLVSRHKELYSYITGLRDRLEQPARSRANDNVIYALVEALRYLSRPKVELVVDSVFTRLHNSEINHPSAYIARILQKHAAYKKLLL